MGKGNDLISLEDDTIITSSLEGKEKCINDLLTKNGNNFVKDLLKNFQGERSEFNINIKSVPSSEMIINRGGRIVTSNGKTEPNSATNTLEISINKSYAETHSSLEVARTILHEYIHADIFRKLTLNRLLPENAKFSEIYENFKNGNFEASPQHETMAKLYVNSMRDALKDFHKNVLTKSYNNLTNHFDGNEPTDEFYEALSWVGLKDRNVKEYQDLTTAKKNAINRELQKLSLLSKRNNPCN